MVLQCCCKDCESISDLTQKVWLGHAPPEFLDAVEGDDTLDVFHPPMCSICAGCLGQGSLRKRGDGSLGEISAFCGR